MPKKLRRRFMLSLSPSERQTLKAARHWYQSVYLRKCPAPTFWSSQ